MPPCAVRVVWCGRIKLHRYASEEGARRAIDAALEQARSGHGGAGERREARRRRGKA